MKSAKRLLALMLALIIVIPVMTSLLSTTAEASGLSMSMLAKNCTVTLDPNSAYCSASKKTITVSFNSNGSITSPSCPYTADTATKFVFKGWEYNGTTYAEGKEIPVNKDTTVSLYAVWQQKSETSTGSTVSSGSTIYGTFLSGITGVSSFRKSYKSGEEFTLPGNSFSGVDASKYTFKGWNIDGTIYKAGATAKSDSDFSIYAEWEENNKIAVSDASGVSSSVSSSISSSTSSVVASSSTSSVVSSSSTAAKPSSSSSSAAASISSGSSSESTSSEPEEVPSTEFKPIELAYSITGDLPTTEVNYVLEEDIGGTPQLWVSIIDEYTAVDDVTAQFISGGETLAAFDLSLLLDGSTYTGASKGTVTFALNGTQSGAESSFDEKVLAMVHVISADKFTGSSYYMADGSKAYLNDTATGTKSEVSNISFEQKNGISVPVIGDVDSLSTFAYLAANGIIVEVSLIPDVDASEAAINVSSLSPVMLVNFEIGKAAAGGLNIPIWLWIVIAVVVLIVVALLVFYFINKSSENKRNAARQERLENFSAKAGRTNESAGAVTGFDD